jgi:hypothetical protein
MLLRAAVGACEHDDVAVAVAQPEFVVGKSIDGLAGMKIRSPRSM